MLWHASTPQTWSVQSTPVKEETTRVQLVIVHPCMRHACTQTSARALWKRVLSSFQLEKLNAGTSSAANPLREQGLQAKRKTFTCHYSQYSVRTYSVLSSTLDQIPRGVLLNPAAPEVDLEAMMQKNTSSGKERRLRRAPQGEAAKSSHR